MGGQDGEGMMGWKGKREGGRRVEGNEGGARCMEGKKESLLARRMVER